MGMREIIYEKNEVVKIVHNLKCIKREILIQLFVCYVLSKIMNHFLI